MRFKDLKYVQSDTMTSKEIQKFEIDRDYYECDMCGGLMYSRGSMYRLPFDSSSVYCSHKHATQAYCLTELRSLQRDVGDILDEVIHGNINDKRLDTIKTCLDFNQGLAQELEYMDQDRSGDDVNEEG